MTKQEAVEVISEVLEYIQSISGRNAQQISERTYPIGGLEQFDSLNGVQATSELSSRLGIEIPSVCIFMNEEGTKALTVGEIADRICSLAIEKEAEQ